MSMEALNWAMPIQLENSSWKFVLVCMANRCRGGGICYPSVAQLVEDTCQNRKTVLAGIAKLLELGLIKDTGDRTGATRQVIVYQLMVDNSPELGTVGTFGNGTENGPISLVANSTEYGTSTKNGAVPKTDLNSTVFTRNSTVFGLKQSQKRDTEPNYPTEPNGTHKERGKRVAREEPAEFRIIRSIYPKRAGDQGWNEALDACNARLCEGRTWEQLTEGTRRYADYCESLKQVGTQYVKAAKTFFGTSNHFLQDWKPPPTRGQQREDRNISASLEWLAQQEANDASH